MKNYIFISFAFFISFLASEVFVAQVLKYPHAYGGDTYYTSKQLKDHNTIRIREPYTKILNTEGNIKIFEFNNIGIPGPDVDTTIKEGYVYLLGDSYIEAMSVPKEEQAASILNNKLIEIKSQNQVLNMGISAGDPFVMWFRIAFFEKLYKPEYVFLVLESLERINTYLSKYDTTDFTLPEYFATKKEDGWIYKHTFFFRKHSSFLNLISNGLVYSSTFTTTKDINRENTKENITLNNKITTRLRDCLKNYKNKYRDKFYLVSITENNAHNEMLKKECDKLCVKFIAYNIMGEENRINGKGHLNKYGNIKLADVIMDEIIR